MMLSPKNTIRPGLGRPLLLAEKATAGSSNAQNNSITRTIRRYTQPVSMSHSPLSSPERLRYSAAMIRNIIFDWSGTLVDDLPAVWKATNYVLTQAERAEMSLEQFRAEFCLPFTLFYERHVSHIPLPQLETWFHSCFRESQDSVCELPHARDFLQFCRAQRVRTFLLSTVNGEHFAVQSGKTGFGEYLDKPYLGVWDKR